jgi:hypothetical protein
MPRMLSSHNVTTYATLYTQRMVMQYVTKAYFR